MTHPMRYMIAIAACIAASWVGAQQRPAQQRPHVLLLGTGGGPGGREDRAGIATLLEAGGRRYLIDAGGGVSRQLAFAGIAERDVPLVFLTHLHDDHYAGLLSLASFAYSTRGKGLALIGPPGSVGLAKALADVMAISARIRSAEAGSMPPVDAFLSARDVQDGAVFSDGNVAVTAMANSHYALVNKAQVPTALSLSYRFAVGGKSIVFTGDTGPLDALVAFAKDADVMVAEMATEADRAMVPPPVRRHMDIEHLSPIQVGDLARLAGVRKLVLSHVGRVDQKDLAQLREHYSGPVVLGKDLQTIEF